MLLLIAFQLCCNPQVTLKNILKPFSLNCKEDEDGNGLGDICTSGQDYDNDGVDDSKDNCLMMFNPEQLDDDSDGLGNACDDDVDNDGIDNSLDNCKLISNPFQEDFDGDGRGNKCQKDEDGDGRVIFFSDYRLLFLLNRT